jgi:hypothetical protein
MQPILLDPGSNETLGVYAATKHLAPGPVPAFRHIENGTYYQIKEGLIWRIHGLLPVRH